MSSILVSAPDDWDSLGQFTSSLGTLTNAVDFAILILTILGAGGVITLMLLREYNVGKVRDVFLLSIWPEFRNDVLIDFFFRLGFYSEKSIGTLPGVW